MNECSQCGSDTLACRHIDGELAAFVMLLPPDHPLGLFVTFVAPDAPENPAGLMVYHGADKGLAVEAMGAWA